MSIKGHGIVPRRMEDVARASSSVRPAIGLSPHRPGNDPRRTRDGVSATTAVPPTNADAAVPLAPDTAKKGLGYRRRMHAAGKNDLVAGVQHHTKARTPLAPGVDLEAPGDLLEPADGELRLCNQIPPRACG